MASSVSLTTVVQTATSGPPLNDQQFQGWWLGAPGAPTQTAINCPTSSSLIFTSRYAQCCSYGATTCSIIWTSCHGHSPQGAYDPTSCGSCQTMSVYQQYPAGSQIPYTQIVCADTKWPVDTIYQTIYPTTATTETFTLTSVSPRSTATLAPATSTAGVAGATQPASATNTKKSSDAWIAGAVIGPVVAIVLLAVLVWFYRSRRKRRNASQHPEISSAPYYSDLGSTFYSPRSDTQSPRPVSQQQQPQQKYHQNARYEMATNDEVHELR